MNKRINMQAQGGFTLIELIVVIVILGILAATALPRFTNLAGDARVASLNAARGALTSTAAMTHGRWLINPTTTPTVNAEGAIVTMHATSGYPVADAELAQAAGLNPNDYTVVAAQANPVAATANTPAVPANSIAIIPASAAGTPTGLTCFVMYTTPLTVNTQPIVSNAPTAANCQ